MKPTDVAGKKTKAMNINSPNSSFFDCDLFLSVFVFTIASICLVKFVLLLCNPSGKMLEMWVAKGIVFG